MKLFGGIAALLLLVVLPGLASAWKNRFHRRDLLEDWGKKSKAKLLSEDLVEDVSGYWREIRSEIPAENTVDDTTWRDCDMDEIFRRMDFTMSAAGSEALYAMLRVTGEPEEALKRRSEGMEALRRDPESLRALLSGLALLPRQRFSGAVDYLFSPKRSRPAKAWPYYALAVAPILIVLGGVFFPPLLLGLALSFLANLIVYFVSDLRWWREKNAVAHIAQVLNAAKALSKRDCPALRPEMERLQTLSRELRPLARKTRSLIPDDTDSLMGILALYPRVALMRDMVRLCRAGSAMEKYAPQLKALYHLMGELDALQSLAALRESRRDWCAPAFLPDLRVEFQRLVHPLLQNPVPNDAAWSRPALVTGSNASGKSTFAKAVAVNCILAQTICSCFAASFALKRSRVMTSMAIRDNLLEGESYFLAEIRSLKRILDASEEETPVLAFVDEILRGTNTIERIAASASVMRGLSQKNALLMVATHDIELTRMLKEGFENWHFREEVFEEGVKFSYELLPGPASSRNALLLLDRMGFGKEVVQRAERLVREFEQTHAWPTL